MTVTENRIFTKEIEEIQSFVSNSTESTWIHLANARDWTMPGDAKESWFHPDFTYPIYGEDERIYGFTGLKLKVCFTCASMRPLIRIEYDEKKSDASVEENVLHPLLATCFSQNANIDDISSVELPAENSVWTMSDDVFGTWLKEQDSFKPMGDKIHEFTCSKNEEKFEEEKFEVYHCTFETPRFKEFHRRIQPFVLWLIEGGSFIDEEDHRWEAYLIFQRSDSNAADFQYKFVGYSTCYSYFLYPDKIRKRISQFIVLPPHQSKGIGGSLYRFLYDRFVNDDQIVDITVEDPTEGFADMRTINDLRLLLKEKVFENSEFSQEDIDRVRSKYKLSKQQATLLSELYRLHQLNPKNKGEMQKYRIWVKKRIYRKNEELLGGEDEHAVKQKLEETFNNVIDDYRKILNRI